jgi:hypothetical protein
MNEHPSVERERLRASILRFRNRPPPPTTVRVSKWDTRLKRLANFSHFGLLVLAVFGYIYTVIPVYQKSLLDEQIAKKELELKQANDAIAAKEIELRRKNEALESAYVLIRASAVHNFVFYVGAECSGMLLAPETLDQLGEPLNKQEPITTRMLAIDVDACLAESLTTTPFLKELRTADRDSFADKVRAIGKSLSFDRTKAQRDYDAVLVRARTHPESLPPLAPPRDQAFRLMAPFMTPQQAAALKLHEQIENEQWRVVSSYTAKIRHEVATLQSFKWPPTNGGK